MQLVTPAAEMQYELLFLQALVFATQRAGVKVVLHISVAALQVLEPQVKVPMHEGPELPPPPPLELPPPPPVPPPLAEPPPVAVPPPVAFPPPLAEPPPPPDPLLQLDTSLLPSVVHSKAAPLKQSFSPQSFELLLSPLNVTVQSQAAPGSQEENSSRRVNITREMVRGIRRMPMGQAPSPKRAQKSAGSPPCGEEWILARSEHESSRAPLRCDRESAVPRCDCS